MPSLYPLINLLIVLATLLGTVSQSIAGTAEISLNEQEHQYVRAPAEYLIAPKGSSLEQVQRMTFRPLTESSVNQGVSGEEFWIRFRLGNRQGDSPHRWILHHETSYLDNLTVHLADNGGSYQTVELSDRRPFSDRPLAYRNLAYAHDTPAGGYTDVYIRLGFDIADAVSLNVILSNADAFAERAGVEYIVFGLYFGIMGTLLAIALLGAVLLRQALYLYYALFLAASVLMWAALNGFGFQYLWPSSVFWQNEGFHIIYLAVAITAIQFSREFLQTGSLFPRLNRVMIASQAVMGAGIALRFMGFYQSVLVLAMLSIALLSALSVVGYLAWRRGRSYARWYTLAWLAYGLGLLISVMSATTPMFNWGMRPLVFAQACSVLEALLLLVALAERLIAWERERRHALTLAEKDPLTGLGNRRVFLPALERYQQRFRETGQPVYLIMIDLDHFKSLNDRYGHDAGDAVLKDLGRLLQRTCRPDDTSLRYGGEEFAVLTQVPSEGVALGIAERIRESFARTPTRYRGKLIQHTLTAGLAPVFSAERQVPPDEVIHDADAALYEAKSRGRNTVVLHGIRDNNDNAVKGLSNSEKI